MRQTILIYALFASSVLGTMVLFHLSAIVALTQGNPIHFSQSSAKHHSL